MAVLLVFAMGIANFAMHRATMESGHPIMRQMRGALNDRAGGYLTYILEFVILLSALGFAAMGSLLALPVYAIYTGMNGVAAWLILTGRI